MNYGCLGCSKEFDTIQTWYAEYQRMEKIDKEYYAKQYNKATNACDADFYKRHPHPTAGGILKTWCDDCIKGACIGVNPLTQSLITETPTGVKKMAGLACIGCDAQFEVESAWYKEKYMAATERQRMNYARIVPEIEKEDPFALRNPNKSQTWCIPCVEQVLAGINPRREAEMARKINWYDFLDKLELADRLLLLGPPGTGKSRTAVESASKRKHGSKGCHRVTMTEGAGIEDLLGMFHLKEGQTIWIDGPATMALREGATLLIDEIDHHSPEVGALLYALLDDAPQITLPTGEAVKAAKGYRVIATTNNAVSALPEAVIDRFEGMLLANVPHPAAIEMLEPKEQSAVTQYYKSLPVTTWTWTGAMTVRRMRAFHRLKHVADEISVAELVFGKAAKEVLSVLTTAGRK